MPFIQVHTEAEMPHIEVNILQHPSSLKKINPENERMRVLPQDEVHMCDSLSS